jgi:hypothetical protein
LPTLIFAVQNKILTMLYEIMVTHFVDTAIKALVAGSMNSFADRWIC